MRIISGVICRSITVTWSMEAARSSISPSCAPICVPRSSL